MNGKKKLIITMAVALILLVGVTISYGYIALVSTSKNQEIGVGTGKIHLELDDADSGSVDANLNLGGSVTKTLKITNKGTKPGKVQINWKNLINTYNSRSLSYALESSNNKTSGYTSVETIRDNVPVSTEAKDVPLSKEITIPVSSAPIYYKLTITFNNLSDVDQSEDVNATLTTQFSLSEPENISKKVIAVLNGNVKTNDPDFSGPAPRYKYHIYLEDPDAEYEIADLLGSSTYVNNYVIYGDGYETSGDGNIYLTNPQVGKYKDIYSSLVGKYSMFLNYENEETALDSISWGDSYVYYIKSATEGSALVDGYTYVKTFELSELSAPVIKSMSAQNNYFTYGDKIKIESDGRILLEDPKVCKWSECYANLVGKYILRLTGSTTNSINNTGTTSAFYINSAELSTLNYSRVNRVQAIDYSYNGVYKAEDDYGTSYYYRGSVENNYFKFGGFYWRIIRVNGDGSIRLAYAGTKAHPNGENIDSEISIRNLDISKRTAGYMIGIDETTDAFSTSKQQADTNKYDTALKAGIDSWYEANIKTNTANGNMDMGTYLSDTLFCSDRSVAPSAHLWDENDTTLGYGKNYTVYGTYHRIDIKAPSLKCPLKNDRFTVSDTKVGNGALKYKIATITGDEYIMAGSTLTAGSTSVDKDYLKLAGYGSYSMSPARIYIGTNTSGEESYSYTDIQRLSKSVIASNLSVNMSAIPVINISSEHALKVTGTGTMSDPFMIPGVN